MTQIFCCFTLAYALCFSSYSVAAQIFNWPANDAKILRGNHYEFEINGLVKSAPRLQMRWSF